MFALNATDGNDRRRAKGTVVTDVPEISGPAVDAESEPRFALRPDPPVPRYLDGAWWPRSTDLATELPALLAKVAYRLGQANLIGYHVDAWTETPPQVEIAGHTVTLVGVTSDEPNSVVLVAKSNRIALLVIPPHADEHVAQQELDAASEPVGGDSPVSEDVLTDLAEKLASQEGNSDPRRLAEIRRWCEEAAQRFVDAPVQVFVPVLIENIVRDRMTLHAEAAES
jgi:hypothetical protein